MLIFIKFDGDECSMSNIHEIFLNEIIQIIIVYIYSHIHALVFIYNYTYTLCIYSFVSIHICICLCSYNIDQLLFDNVDHACVVTEYTDWLASGCCRLHVKMHLTKSR